MLSPKVIKIRPGLFYLYNELGIFGRIVLSLPTSVYLRSNRFQQCG